MITSQSYWQADLPVHAARARSGRACSGVREEPDLGPYVREQSALPVGQAPLHHYTEANAEVQRLFALSLEDSSLTPPSSRNATATSQPSKQPLKLALTTTWIAWTWVAIAAPSRAARRAHNPSRRVGHSNLPWPWRKMRMGAGAESVSDPTSKAIWVEHMHGNC